MFISLKKIPEYTIHGRRILSGYVQSFLSMNASQSLQLLGIADAVGKILRGQTGLAHFRTAYVGCCGLIGLNHEALTDAGFIFERIFEGRDDDRYHPRIPLKDLKATNYDVIVVADDDPVREALLHQMLLEQNGIASSSFRIILLRKLYAAHMWALNQMKAGRAFSCLNIRKLSCVAASLYLTPPDGCVIEVGCYRGGTTVYMAKLQRYLGLKRRIYACDTFEGMPEALDQDKGGEFVYTSGQFTDNKVKKVANCYAAHGVLDKITICPGLVQDTLPGIRRNESSVSFALADTDQYAGTKASLDHLMPCFVRGSIMVIDDTSVVGVDKAIQEALVQHPEYLHVRLTHNFDFLQTGRPGLK